ncbi:nuclear transport factor 2 family protein [Candidatus Binatia bacterium]|nr:nuclear transport factor 2 family protein [Candidatus Binatia bacterium]
MQLLDRYLRYAAAFETAYASDDWNVLDPLFTEDAVYETIAAPPFGTVCNGLAAIKAFFTQSVNGFDRRFDTRNVEIVEGPTERDGTVWIRWAATYTRAGLPALRMEGEETAVFAGDRIARLEDRIPEAQGETVLRYLATHGDGLKPLA